MGCACKCECCGATPVPTREVRIQDDNRAEGHHSLYIQQPYGQRTYTGLTFSNRHDAEMVQRVIAARWATK